MKHFSLILSLFFLAFLSFASAQDLTDIDFTLKDISGEERSFQQLLKSFREKGEKGVTIISFWAMWCEPCKQEMKALVPIYEKLADKNVHYIAINLDTPRSLAKVKSYVNAQRFPYIILLDPNSEIFNKLNGQSMPYSLIVKNTGSLIEKRVGFLAGDEQEIEQIVVKGLE